MQQETLVAVGLIVALTIAYWSVLEVAPESTAVVVAESAEARAPGFIGIRQVSALAVKTGSERN